MRLIFGIVLFPYIIANIGENHQRASIICHGFSMTSHLSRLVTSRTPITSPAWMVASTTDAVSQQLIDDKDDSGVVQETKEDEKSDDALLAFVDVVDNTPVGEMTEDEVILLRNIMEELSLSASTKSAEACRMVHKMLERLMNEYKFAIVQDDEERAEFIHPTTADFNLALTAWEESRAKEAAKNAMYILSKMQGLFSDGMEAVKPDLASYNSVLKTLSIFRERGNDNRAYSLFEQMQEAGVAPDAHSYSHVISAIAKQKGNGAAPRAESLLLKAASLFPPHFKPDGSVGGIDVESFNVVLTAWAKSKSDNSPERAEKLLAVLDDINSQPGSEGALKPNIYSFTALVDAYAQQNDWTSISQAERIVMRMTDQYLSGSLDFGPDLLCWTIVMSAWKRLASKGNRNAPERAGDLLERMEKWSDEGKLNTKPDNVAYFTVLTSWAISKEDGAAEKADAILEKVLKFYMAGDLSMKPSPKSFRVVIDAYVKKSLPQGLKRSEALLARMEQLHGKIDNEHNDLADSYKSLLFGYCKFGGNPTKAESFLRAMIENGMKPDSFCFDKILEAYTQSDDPNALPRSCGIFELMEQCRVSGDLKPNERVYTSFIRALTKGNVKNLAKKSRIVLDRMQDLYHAGNKGIEPTVFTYNAVLHACAACSDLESVEERTQAFEVALKTFNELRKIPKEHCDHVTFGNLMRCAPLMQDETKKIAFLTATFRQCCQEGWINSYVIRDLQNSSPESLWRDLLLTPTGIVDMDDFPMEWSKSLQRRK